MLALIDLSVCTDIHIHITYGNECNDANANAFCSCRSTLKALMLSFIIKLSQHNECITVPSAIIYQN